jgi:hypothetical protein
LAMSLNDDESYGSFKARENVRVLVTQSLPVYRTLSFPQQILTIMYRQEKTSARFTKIMSTTPTTYHAKFLAGICAFLESVNGFG